MAQAITDSLVPFIWFLIPVFIAALALLLLLLFAVQTSRTAKWFLYWLDSRGIRRPESRLRALLVRRAQGRPARSPETSAEVSGAAGEGAPRTFLKARARQRLQEKAGAESRKSVAERLADLSGSPAEAPLAPSVSEEVLRRLDARSRAVLGETRGPPGPIESTRPTPSSRPPTLALRSANAAASGASPPAGAQALQTSRQMTESMLRSLEEQVRQGLLTPQTFEELKARLVAKQGGGVQRS